MTYQQKTKAIWLRRMIKSTAVASVFVSSFGALAMAEPIELVYNIFIPSQALIVSEGLIPWARDVEAASNGTLKLTIPTSSIAPTPQLWDAVEDGLADIALVVNTFRSNQVTLPAILNIPLVDANAEQASRALWETHYKYFEAANEFGDLIPLGGFTTNGPHLMSVSKHVNNLEDLSGMKVRVEGANIVDLFDSLGATALGATGLDSFELLTGGIADAALAPFGSAVVQGQVGVTNEITTFPGGFSRSGFTLVMNRDKFESLPEDAQNALLSVSGVDLSARLGAIVDMEEVDGRETFLADGANITAAGPEFVDAVRQKGQFIVDQWLEAATARDLNAQEVLDFYYARIEASK
jgi:TRAP-type C4-dicarboxylate transport system substrate-binding protein